MLLATTFGERLTGCRAHHRMTVRFEHETMIGAPQEAVFDLSLDIDAHRASMSASGERAIAGVTSGRIGLGQDVTWRATHFGIPFTMTSRVTELERPHRFVDQQVDGPFRSFHHEHLLTSAGAGTLMTDRVQFDAPLGVVGRLVEWAVLGRYLRHLIEVRGEYLKAEAERRHRPGGGSRWT
jgi:ligand-binding SRPBCC domain-containing protein